MRKTPAERFWSRVLKRSDNECWNWDHPNKVTGYGFFGVNGSSVYAHRFSFEIHFGEIQDGMCVLHRCDNPSCVNPKHLFQGSMRDNSQDMARKKRGGFQRRPDKVPRGRKHPLAKLNDDIVRAIKASALPKSQLARKYGVAESLIYRIVNGRSWAHVK